MLEELIIKNYALIESLTLTLNEGLNILSGETGAGKSIMIGALGVLLGSKTDTGVIRTGTDEAAVSGIVRVRENQSALQWLDDHGITPEDGTIIIRRSIKQNGRGAIYIQANPVTRAELEELTGFLFDMHGQHEHQSLLQVENHRRLLDQYGRLEQSVGSFNKNFMDLASLKKQYEKLTASERERAREIEMLEYAVSEIEQAKLLPGEEEDLLEEKRILSQHEKLFSFLDEVHESTNAGNGGAFGYLRTALSALQNISQIDTGQEQNSRRFESAFLEIEDVVETVRQYQLGLDFSPERLESVEERLAEIRKLQKKYGETIAEVLDYAVQAGEKLSMIKNWDEEKAVLSDNIARMEREVNSQAQEISRKRKTSALELQKQIEQNLHHLGMPNARFLVQVRQKETETGRPLCGPYGLDLIEFEISPNTGEPLKRLRDIASGGEISRIMLAIKTVLAETDFIETLIFDEIDAGIGGEVAISVGEHLQKLSGHKQVLCITHLATIAARAAAHLKVEKFSDGERTLTEARFIQGREKVEEIARMLSGDKNGETALHHAEEMLKKYGAR